jgi:DNA-binding NtrC family response regulator
MTEDSMSCTRDGAEPTAALVVDADPAVRQVTARMLESAGYAVLTAVDVAEALRVLAAQPVVRVVILDVVPGVNCRRLARDVAGVRRGVELVFTSGHPAVAARTGRWPFIRKPFRRQDVLGAVAYLARLPRAGLA